MNTGKFIEKDCGGYYLNKNAPGLSPEESLPVVIDDIKMSISKLSQLSEYLVILYPIPNHAVSTNEVVLRNNLFNESLSYPESIWQDRVKFSKEIYDNIDLDNIIRVYSDELFCNTFIDNECVAKFGNNIFYNDGNHLSTTGANVYTDFVFLNINNKTDLVFKK